MVARIWWARSISTLYKTLRVTFRPRKMVGLLFDKKRTIECYYYTIYPARTKLHIINEQAAVWSVRYYTIDALYYILHALARPMLLLSAIAGCISVLKIVVRLSLEGANL